MKMISALVIVTITTTVTRAATFTITSTNDSGPGSLRDAITAANANRGLDTIVFNIPGTGVQTIQPASPLPALTDPAVIDGYTQPGASPNTLTAGDNAALLIVLNGTNAGPTACGLNLSTGGCTGRGLVINGFGSHGVFLSAEGSNTITGNFIGTDAAGAVASGNGWAQDAGGIYVAQSSGTNLIGGTTPAARNLISGNPEGIVLTGSDGNKILGNFVGTDATGSLAIPNTQEAGVLINGGTDNHVGNATPGSGNLIAGNVKTNSAGWWDGGFGIEVSTDGTIGIEGNLIGTDVTGKIGLGNHIGGHVRANGGRIADNVISGNGYWGLWLDGTAFVFQGNFIGTDKDGISPLGNGSVGLWTDATSSLFGGTAPGSGNVFSCNGGYGLEICNASGHDNVVQGDFIGTDVAGTNALGQQNEGLAIFSGATNLIGGTSPGTRNVISGNSGTGVDIRGNQNTLQGNFVGTDVTGTNALPNGTGVNVGDAAVNNLIWGTTPGAGNLISGNVGSAVAINGNGVCGTRLQGNLIGTDISGLQPLGNAQGVSINGANDNVVGGIEPGASNVIAHSLSGPGVGLWSLDGLQWGIGNSIRANSIFDNCAGVALFPPANSNQCFPLIKSATVTGDQTSIVGLINSAPNTALALDFYANIGVDHCGYAEGQTYLGFSTIITDVTGESDFIVTLMTGVTAGDVITAIATDPAGNSSSFAAPVTVVATSQTATLSVVLQPQDMAVSEGQKAAFSLKASVVPEGLHYLVYQWRKNSVAIPGADSPSFVIPEAATANNGALYDCVVAIPGASVTSRAALLTVTNDLTPPKLLSAEGSFTLTNVTLIFSEPVNVADATSPTNYLSSGGLDVSNAVLLADKGASRNWTYNEI
jgi:parallel beta-helix repeat protein